MINELIFQSNYINKDFNRKLLELKFSDQYDQIRKFSFHKIGTFFKILFQLTYSLIRKKPDLIYFSFMPVGIGLYRDWCFLLIMKLFNNKVILHLHNRGIARFSRKKMKKWIYSQVFKNVHVIHLSEKLKSEEFKNLKIPMSVSFHIVPNAILYEGGDRKMSRKSMINILFLSNLMDEKGIFHLIKVFKNLLENHPYIHLDIVGASANGNEIKLLEILEENPALKEHVTLHGPLYKEKKNEIFINSDIFVFPSFFEEECFPLVILEAMAVGLPIVATSVGAVDEILNDGENALLCEPGNLLDLQEKLERIILNKELREYMRLNNLNKYKTQYKVEILENNILKVMNEIISVNTM